MKLGDKVKKRREELGLSQEELAFKMGYKSRTSINKIEKGRAISQKIIYRLSEVLEVTPAYLMGWEEDPVQEQKKEAAQMDSLIEEKKDEIRRLFDQMSPEQQETFLLEGYRIVFGKNSEDNLNHPAKRSQEDDSGDYGENH